MFQDKKGEETDKEDENIPENPTGDNTARGIRAKNVPIQKGGGGGGGGGQAKIKGLKKEEREIERKLLICYSAAPWEIEFFLLQCANFT